MDVFHTEYHTWSYGKIPALEMSFIERAYQADGQ